MKEINNNMEVRNIGESVLEYNSLRDHLLLPEYGRHMQNIIKHAREIEDPAKRKEYVSVAIELMNQIIPGNKSVKEIEDKLWNHLFFIASYDLDVEIPEGVNIHRKDNIFIEPGEVDYPQKQIPFRHYGWNVRNMIEKAIAMEEGPKREEFAKIIAAYMKLAYRTWGKEQFVNDELIKEDLRKMSKGQLDVSDDAYIDNYKNVSSAPANSNNNKKKNFKSKGGSNNQGNYRRFSSGKSNNNKNKKRY